MAEEPASPPSSSFDRERHVTFLALMLQSLPSDYETMEINTLTLAYFIVSGLAILGALDRIDREQVSSWVLSFLEHPRDGDDLDGKFYGFHSSRSSHLLIDDCTVLAPNGSHLASTYCALSILKTIGCDFSSIDSESILTSMKNLQQPDGSFMPTHIGGESDLRFVYCAASICYMLNNWTGMDKQKTVEFISRCQSYDGGFGLVPGSESHGGATYCASAALLLMGYLEAGISSDWKSATMINIQLLLEWCLQRQSIDGGFQGRANKASDTCYAFWVGGILKILGAWNMFDKDALRAFLLSCQSQYGGFTKYPEVVLPDLYHSYYGLSAFSFLEEPGLEPLCAELGVAAHHAAEKPPLRS